MKLLKPSWVSHDGHPIFSLDIHPDGSRFATGGQGEDSGRVVVWNMAPVHNDEDEKDENIPKMLCQMDNHLACVNCVRWSNSGRYLASGGDDKVLMIWQTGRYSGGSAILGSGGKVNVEQWRCASTLRGHSGDILDLAWSPNDALLASCSVDNSVIIWNSQKMPDIVTVLRGHSGLVKGIAWDPVGKYLASQSDDKSLRIWRTGDWHQETVVTEPFDECGGTTHVLRLSWSPDGQYLVSAHAMNNSGPTAQIIERDGWRAEKDFVGHRKAITCVRFNPNILSKSLKMGGKVHHYCCCAIGSRDRSLSIWLTALKRPLVVIHDLFNNSVLDVSWNHRGDQIMACSWDGTVASLSFEDNEIGKSLSEEQKDLYYQKVYGKSLSMANRANNSINTVIENPEILRLKESQRSRETDKKAAQEAAEREALKEASVVQAKASEGPLNRQIEVRTADGRRRITPMFIAPAPDLGDIPQPFNSRPHPTFSSSTERQSKIVIEKRDETPSTSTTPTSCVTSNSDAAPGAMAGAHSDSSQPAFAASSKPAMVNGTAISEQVKVSHSPATPVPIVISVTPTLPADTLKLLDKSKYKDNYKVKLIEARKESSSTKPPALKRGPGRPPLAEKIAQQVVHQQVVPERDITARPTTFHTGSDLHLPALRVEKTHSVQVPMGKGEPSMLLELENSIAAAHSVLVHKLKCTKSDGNAWEVLLPAKGCAAAGSRHLVCIVCDDCSLSAYSIHGRRLHPSLVLTSMASRLTCSGHHVMVITSRGCVTVWDLKNGKIIVKNESLLPIMSGAAQDMTISGTSLTERGCPLVSLSVGRSYAFSTEMGCWMLVHNSEDVMHQCSDHHACLPPQGASASTNGSHSSSQPLAALQSHFKRPTQQAQRLFRTNPAMQRATTLCHIDNQLSAALSLNSANEYKFWLLTLARYLVQEGLEERLREVCDGLLGPVGPKRPRLTPSDKSPENELYVQGLHKHDLLQEILPIVGSNLQLQRLFAEYQEQLDLSRT